MIQPRIELRTKFAYITGVMRSSALKNFLIFCAALTVIYNFAIQIPFAQNDDYYYWAYDNRSSFTYHPQYVFFELVGRHCYNLIAHFMAKVIWTISDLSLVRFLTLVVHATSMMLLLQRLREFGLSRYLGILIVICIFTLPGIQVGVLWVTLAPFAFAILFSLLSARVLDRVDPKSIVSRGSPNLSEIFLLASSTFLLIIAVDIYQPWAMFFLVPLAGFLLFSSDLTCRDILARTVLNLSIFFAGTAIYFVAHKLFYLPYYFSIHPERKELFLANETSNFALSSNIAERLVGLLKSPFVLYGTNLWNIHADWRVAYLVMGILVVGILVGGMRAHQQIVSTRSRQFPTIAVRLWFLRVIFLFVLLPASLLPVLAASGGHSGFRVLLPFSTIVFLMLVHTFMTIPKVCVGLRPQATSTAKFLGSRISSALITLIFVGGALSAAKNVRDSALNNYAELNFMRSKILEHLHANGPLHSIHVVLPTYGRSYAGLPTLGDEFNITSAGNWPNIQWMLRAILVDYFGSRDDIRIQLARGEPQQLPITDSVLVTISDPNEPTNLPDGTLLIDLNAFLKPENLDASMLGSGTVSVSRNSGSHGISRAFDGSLDPDSFWEVGGPFPVTLDWYFLDAFTLRTYTFASGEFGGRMPEAWQLFASNDGEDWVLLDRRRETQPWSRDQHRTYSILEASAYRRYRWIFERSFDPNILRVYEITLN